MNYAFFEGFIQLFKTTLMQISSSNKNMPNISHCKCLQKSMQQFNRLIGNNKNLHNKQPVNLLTSQIN